jgi:predicted DsbA family dithiol-disulfide isomerase
MTIDIWSDVMCPFCYIGKRKLEAGLEQFEHKNNIEIVWHSFQLDPGMEYEPGVDIHSYLAARKGQTREWSVRVHNQMTQTAKENGLTYNFDTAIIANSFNAHRLIQMAKAHGLGDAAEERLFKAYFTDGKNISDIETLIELGTEIGLNKTDVAQMLHGNSYEAEFFRDIDRARSLGINGVPFFVIDNKYGISGAQPADVFLGALRQAWAENEADNQFTETDTSQNAVCTAKEGCE